MANTLADAPTSATTIGDTDLMHIKVGTGANSDKKITGANVKAMFATAAQGGLADSAVQPGDDANTLGSGAATDGYVLTADGAGNAAWEAPAGGGISEVSEDTSPTLGGDLDLGGFKLLSGASNDAIIKLGDNAGARKLSITDSDDAEVFRVNSNGGATFIANAARGALSVTTDGHDPLIQNDGTSGVHLYLHNAKQGTYVELNGNNRGPMSRKGVFIGENKNNGPVGIQGKQDVGAAIWAENYLGNFIIQNYGRPSVDEAKTALELIGAAASASATTNLVGGNITITGGAGASGSVGNAHGGNVVLTGGTGYGTGHKGYIILDLSSLPASDPSVNGALWLNSGTLTVSGA